MPCGKLASIGVAVHRFGKCAKVFPSPSRQETPRDELQQAPQEPHDFNRREHKPEGIKK